METLTPEYGAFFRLAKNTGKPYNISRICRLLTGAEENAICTCAII